MLCEPVHCFREKVIMPLLKVLPPFLVHIYRKMSATTGLKDIHLLILRFSAFIHLHLLFAGHNAEQMERSSVVLLCTVLTVYQARENEAFSLLFICFKGLRAIYKWPWQTRACSPHPHMHSYSVYNSLHLRAFAISFTAFSAFYFFRFCAIHEFMSPWSLSYS